VLQLEGAREMFRLLRISTHPSHPPVCLLKIVKHRVTRTSPHDSACSSGHIQLKRRAERLGVFGVAS